MHIDFLEFRRRLAPHGITDPNFLSGIFTQLINADGFGSEGLEFAVSVITGIPPKDQSDVMLGAQLALMHMANMKNGRQFGKAEVGSPLQDSAERTATKLTRICIGLVDALKRHRTGGEQKITVRHVSVADGGQAIVGNVSQNALEKPAEQALSLPAPGQKRDAVSLEDEAIAWREWSAKQEQLKLAVTDSSRPEVAVRGSSRGEPAPDSRWEKLQRRPSASKKTTTLKGSRPADTPRLRPRPRD
jgi:hypothetical protein